MKTSMLNQNQNPSSPGVRIIKISPNKVETVPYRVMPKKLQEQNKNISSKQGSLRHWQSNKDIVFHKILKSDVENQEKNDHKHEAQLVKQKSYYENQIKNIVGVYGKKQIQLEVKCKALEKERNQWKDMAMKLKSQMETKLANIQVANKQSSIKEANLLFVDQQNNRMKVNKAINQDQLNKIKQIQQLTRFKDENRNLKEQIVKLQIQFMSQSKIIIRPQTAPLKVAQLPNSKIVPVQNPNNLCVIRSQSPRDHRTKSPSPSKNMITFSSSPRHKSPSGHSSRHHHEEGHSNNSDPYRQIEKLKKICGKMEKIIAERNEELMKQKTKVLNYKYMGK